MDHRGTRADRHRGRARPRSQPLGVLPQEPSGRPAAVAPTSSARSSSTATTGRGAWRGRSSADAGRPAARAGWRRGGGEPPVPISLGSDGRAHGRLPAPDRDAVRRTVVTGWRRGPTDGARPGRRAGRAPPATATWRSASAAGRARRPAPAPAPPGSPTSTADPARQIPAPVGSRPEAVAASSTAARARTLALVDRFVQGPWPLDPACSTPASVTPASPTPDLTGLRPAGRMGPRPTRRPAPNGAVE